MKKKNTIVLAIALLAFAIISFGVGVNKYQNAKVFKPATATITKIEETYIGTEGHEYEYKVYVRFELSGNKYDAILDSYNSTMKIGDKVDIIYNPESPTEIQTAGAITYLVFFIAGIVSTIGTGLCIFRYITKKIDE